jgi:cytochrome c peroxidase
MRRALATLVLLAACSKDGPPALTGSERAALATLSPASLPPPPADPSNRFADDPAAAVLGQKLFYDPSFSGALIEGDNDGSPATLGMKGETGRVACAGCHVAAAGFLDDRSLGKQISLAAGWNLRRTPSLLDVGQARLLMWDGRRDALYDQVFGPLESRTEMNSGRLFVARQVAARYAADYEAVFGPLPPFGDAARFPALTAAQAGCARAVGGAPPVCHGMPGDGAEYDGMAPADQDAVTRVVVNFGKAVGAFERRLACGQSRFDGWVAGDPAALTPAEQRGAQIFVGKGSCVSCHAGPFLTDQAFHNVGLAPQTVAVVFLDANDRGAAAGLVAALADPLNLRGPWADGDDGRLPAAVSPQMEGAFRTPGLRCVARRPSFMHTGQLRTLEDVVAFFDRGGHPAGYPGKSELQPLGLGAAERSELAAFLRTLEGPGPAAALLGPP